MAGPKERKYFERARNLYVKEFLTPAKISELLPVSENTIYGWVKKGGWEAQQTAALTETLSLSEMLQNRLKNLVNAFQVKEGLTGDDLAALPKISDAICKTIASLKKLEKGYDLRVLYDVIMGKYVEFLRSLEGITPGEIQMHSSRLKAFALTLE